MDKMMLNLTMEEWKLIRRALGYHMEFGPECFIEDSIILDEKLARYIREKEARGK